MAGVTAHGATFTFATTAGSLGAKLVGISVEAPTAEVTDMTSMTDSNDLSVIAPTGAWTGGAITADFVELVGDPTPHIRKSGILAFASQGYTLNRRCILETASVEARAGEIVRGSLRFRVTDYAGQ